MDVVIALPRRSGELGHATALFLKRRKGEGKGNEQAVIAWVEVAMVVGWHLDVNSKGPCPVLIQGHLIAYKPRLHTGGLKALAARRQLRFCK
jgi:hypothetical protein